MYLYCHIPFWNSGKTKAQFYYFCLYANQVCVCGFFSCCLDMAIDFKKNCCENPYMKRGGLNCCVCLLCLEIYMWKRHLQPVFSKRRESCLWCQVICLLKVSYGSLYFTKLKTPVNLNIILALLEFLVHYIESQVYITSPHYSFCQINKSAISSKQNGGNLVGL